MKKLLFIIPSVLLLLAAVKAQPVRTLAGSAVDASASTGLDCGRPAEYVPRKGSKPFNVRFGSYSVTEPAA